MLQCSTALHASKVFPMFSLVSLYFAYRRDVVMAERHIPALAQATAQAETPAATEAEAPAAARELPLAA